MRWVAPYQTPSQSLPVLPFRQHGAVHLPVTECDGDPVAVAPGPGRIEVEPDRVAIDVERIARGMPLPRAFRAAVPGRKPQTDRDPYRTSAARWRRPVRRGCPAGGHGNRPVPADRARPPRPHARRSRYRAAASSTRCSSMADDVAPPMAISTRSVAEGDSCAYAGPTTASKTGRQEITLPKRAPPMI